MMNILMQIKEGSTGSVVISVMQSGKDIHTRQVRTRCRREIQGLTGRVETEMWASKQV